MVVMKNMDGRNEIETLISVNFGLDFFVGKRTEFSKENTRIMNGFGGKEEDGFGTSENPVQLAASFCDGLFIKREKIGSRNHSSLLNHETKHELCLRKSEC